jgi:hypothetical protein
MARNRIIYQSEALYAGPSPATGYHYGTFTPGQGGSSNVPNVNTNLVKQIQRVQTANYSFTVDRTDVNQFGQLAAIDRVILTNPTVSLDFSYILANLANENNLGFTITTATGGNGVEVSAISGLLNGTQDERNYFIRTVPEGNDAVGFTSTTSGNNGVIGIGNGFVSSYSTEGSVGNFPTTTINVEGLNMNFQQGTSGNFVPAVNPADGSSLANYYQLATAAQNMGTSSASGISALRPGDVTLTIPQSNVGGADVTTMNVQSYTLSFDLSRTPIEKLGNKFAFSRPIDFPLSVNLSVEAQITDLITGDLSVLVCDDSATYSPTITIKTPGCAADKDVVAQYKLKGAKLDSQEYSSDIGSNKTVTLTFSTQVGGPQDTSNGLFISGLV